jgi:FAD dependent oxidoreductase TIGR03364
MSVSAGDVAIIGAGIVGLAHAWSAARRGHQVTVFERGETATGASVRNFGMVWPIGQPAGEWYAIALESRAAWLELAREAGLWVSTCGSIHLAHRDDEWAVLQEFAREAIQLGYECVLLSHGEIETAAASRWPPVPRFSLPGANPEGLRGGLFSPVELCVNPRAALRRIPEWLADRFGVRFEFATTVTEVEDTQVRSADGLMWEFTRTIVCSGADFMTLFPDVFRESGLRRCKLQMMKTVPQPAGWNLGTHIASGLTLRHYPSFAICASLPALRQRIAAETPELDEYGIHVMAAQDDSGAVILGDSHEYDAAIEPFDKAMIDDLILRELRRVIRLPDWTIARRWHGVYARHPTQSIFEAEPFPRVHICTGTGGAGMTMAFGLAERCWERWS